VEYLVSGIPQGVSTEVNLGSNASAMPDEENTDEDDNEKGLPKRRESSRLFRERKAKGSAREKLQTSCGDSDKTGWLLLTSNSLVLL
jgi:hypothetical protein